MRTFALICFIGALSLTLPQDSWAEKKGGPKLVSSRKSDAKRSYYNRTRWERDLKRSKRTGIFVHGYPGRFMGVGLSHHLHGAFRVHGALAMGWAGDVGTQLLMTGGKILVPRWRLSPFLEASLIFGKVQGRYFNPSGGSLLSVMGGLDWLFASGFNIGLGVGRTVSPAVPMGQVYLGYYF